MGLARIAIAVLAVGAAFGLLIIGGMALWGALTNKGSDKPNTASTLPTAPGSTKPKAPASSPAQVGNTVIIHCLAPQCPVFVAGPGPTDVQFNSNLTQNQRRIFNETRLTVAVQDASTVTVTINGRLQPAGHRGEAKTYEVPSPQPLIRGPGKARVLALDETHVSLRIPEPGTYRVAISYSPYWHASTGCLAPRPDGTMELDASRFWDLVLWAIEAL